MSGIHSNPNELRRFELPPDGTTRTEPATFYYRSPRWPDKKALKHLSRFENGAYVMPGDAWADVFTLLVVRWEGLVVNGVEIPSSKTGDRISIAALDSLPMSVIDQVGTAIYVEVMSDAAPDDLGKS